MRRKTATQKTVQELQDKASQEMSQALKPFVNTPNTTKTRDVIANSVKEMLRHAFAIDKHITVDIQTVPESDTKLNCVITPKTGMGAFMLATLKAQMENEEEK